VPHAFFSSFASASPSNPPRSPANFAVYTALLRPHDRIMGLDLPSGGHLTHGFYTYSKQENTRKAVSATSVYFESLPYRVHPDTGLVDFESMASLAALFKPAMLIAGGSAYPRDWDYAAYRKIADDNGALLMMDMAHISGLVATGEAANPFAFCDVVTTTCHKTMRGPRAGMIFYKKDARGFGPKIDQAVFPALQGGPHQHQIAGIATQLREVATPEFKTYIKQVKANAAALGAFLAAKGYTICTGGTDNHMILWDLRPQGMTGSKFEKVCDLCHITLNKNTVPGDRSAGSPGGCRIGTPALTTRGFKEADFEALGGLLIQCLELALKVQATSGKMLKDFVAALAGNPEVAAIKAQSFALATSFPMPGFNAAELKHNEMS